MTNPLGKVVLGLGRASSEKDQWELVIDSRESLACASEENNL